MKQMEKKVYECPSTVMITVEMEGFCAGSTTSYDNAGSAGEGDHVDNPFEEFGSTSATSASGVSTDSFDSWSNY